jgi:hypothetical protein
MFAASPEINRPLAEDHALKAGTTPSPIKCRRKAQITQISLSAAIFNAIDRNY